MNNESRTYGARLEKGRTRPISKKSYSSANLTTITMKSKLNLKNQSINSLNKSVHAFWY